MRDRRLGLVLAGVALAAAAVGGTLARRGPGPVREALAAHTAGMLAEEAGYTRLGPQLRQRAWLLTAPGQPEGVALFTALPDAALGREQVVAPGDLRALQRIRGLAWDAAAQAWTGGGRSVPLAEVSELLVAALPTPTAAAAVLDLLLGEPAPGAPRFADLLLAEPGTLEAIRLVPIRGDRGRLLLDRGRPPFVVTERGYRGLVASFAGNGWPTAWRVLTLQALPR